MTSDNKPQAGQDHVVGTGDYTDYLAAVTGHFWETIWNDPKNASLKEDRAHRNELLEGDTLHIPALREKQESRETDLIHRFKRRGVPFEIVYVIRVGGKVLPDAAYEIKVGARQYEGRTDSDGKLSCLIQPSARTGTLTFHPDEDGLPRSVTVDIKIGPTPPISSIIGRQTRLALLGYAVGTPDGRPSDMFDNAISTFRESASLDPDGGDDGAFLQALDSAFNDLVGGT